MLVAVANELGLSYGQTSAGDPCVGFTDGSTFDKYGFMCHAPTNDKECGSTAEKGGKVAIAVVTYLREKTGANQKSSCKLTDHRKVQITLSDDGVVTYDLKQYIDALELQAHKMKGK